MPMYRLLAGNGELLTSFDAADDEDGTRHGRALSNDYPQPDPHYGAGMGDFRVERREGDSWAFVFAWVPSPS